MKKYITVLFIISISYNLRAQDRHFAWSYNTPSLPKGTVDIEMWNTFGSGRNDYFYNQLQQKLEFELGVTDNIQTSFYLNALHEAIGPVTSSSSLNVTTYSSFSFSNAWKFFLINPYNNLLGVSTYLEYYLSPGEIELEGKLLLDKITEDHWFAFNSTVEAGFETAFNRGANTIISETETDWEWENTLGYMYQCNEHIGIGVEVRNINAIRDDAWLYSAVYAGPTFFYTNAKYFFILNAMPQITNLKGTHKPLELNNEQQFLFRVLMGVTL